MYCQDTCTQKEPLYMLQNYILLILKWTCGGNKFIYDYWLKTHPIWYCPWEVKGLAASWSLSRKISNGNQAPSEQLLCHSPLQLFSNASLSAAAGQRKGKEELWLPTACLASSIRQRYQSGNSAAMAWPEEKGWGIEIPFLTSWPLWS